jgi:EAL domain-containing protein (putative c-di-GMP-specific phosphodiesterase class I)
MIFPDGFNGLAEQTGLIKPLTMFVLDTALEQCAAWRRKGLMLSVAVNVSTRSLMDHEFVTSVKEALARWSFDPAALQLEITESRIVNDFQRAEAVLEALRALGVSIAIDDFGTGFSSLAQLQRLPVDEIKIDKSFVMDMEDNPRNAAIVRATVDLGRDLGLAVTAEGVETMGAYRQLGELGCDYAQGFLISRPATAEACEAIMRQRAKAPSIGLALEARRT